VIAAANTNSATTANEHCRLRIGVHREYILVNLQKEDHNMNTFNSCFLATSSFLIVLIDCSAV